MGFLSGLTRAAIPGVTGLIQGQMAGKDRQRQQEMEALQAMLLQERLNEIPVARKERAEDRAIADEDRIYTRNRQGMQDKRQARLDKRVPRQILDRVGPDGKPRTYAVPEYGGPPEDTGLQPVPQAPDKIRWQVHMDYSGRYGPPGQAVQINPETGEVRPIAAQGRPSAAPGTAIPAAMRTAIAENKALIDEIDQTIAELERNPDATGFVKGLVGSIPGGQYALAGTDPAGDRARQGVGLQRSKVLHDFIGGAQTRIELKNLTDALPERGFDASTNIRRLQSLKERAVRANAAMTGSAPPGIAAPSGADTTDPVGWAGDDPEKLQFLRKQGVIR